MPTKMRLGREEIPSPRKSRKRDGETQKWKKNKSKVVMSKEMTVMVVRSSDGASNRSFKGTSSQISISDAKDSGVSDDDGSLLEKNKKLWSISLSTGKEERKFYMRLNPKIKRLFEIALEKLDSLMDNSKREDRRDSESEIIMEKTTNPCPVTKLSSRSERGKRQISERFDVNRLSKEISGQVKWIDSSDKETFSSSSSFEQNACYEFIDENSAKNCEPQSQRYWDWWLWQRKLMEEKTHIEEEYKRKLKQRLVTNSHQKGLDKDKEIEKLFPRKFNGFSNRFDTKSI